MTLQLDMHPSELFNPSIIDRVRSQSRQMEIDQSLSGDILQLIAQEGWFRVFQPKSLGGLELPLPETVRLFEGLAWLDGNLGWAVNVGAGANMFSGYLSEETAKTIFNSPSVACAGSGAKGGTATRTQDGWVVNARWHHCGGSNHAAYFDGNALLEDENHQPILDNQGEQQFRAFIFPASQGINHHDYTSIGLKAISANDIEAKDVYVPDSHVFSLIRPSPHAQGAIYKFPFAVMAFVNMTVNYSGIALHFEDLYNATAAQSRSLPGTTAKLCENSSVQKYVLGAREPFYSARQAFFDALEDWQSPETQATLIQLSKALSQSSRDFVNALAPLFGLELLDPDGEVNKVWRDAAACGQHHLMSPV